MAEAELAAVPFRREERPTWRGLIHEWSIGPAAALGLLVVVTSSGILARVALGIQALGLVALLTSSAVYHRHVHSEEAVLRARRLDHSMIFVLIAATYTPVCLLALSPVIGVPLLVAMWGAAIVGAVLKLTRLSVDGSVASWLYSVMGWAAVLVVVPLWRSLGWERLGLYALGGLIYTAGGVVLLLRRPNPSPTHFGYHEIWHVCVVLAAAVQLWAASGLA